MRREYFGMGGMTEGKRERQQKTGCTDRTSRFMCAARRRGKHMGGPAVLGYDWDREKHRLVVNPEDAAVVRELFDLYLQHCSLLKISQIAHERGWTTKSWIRKDGARREGGSWDKAKLQRILTSVTYIGQVQHKGEVLPGECEAIVDQGMLDRVPNGCAGVKPSFPACQPLLSSGT